MALPSARRDDARGEKRSLRGLSLCAGAGGLDLGLHIAAHAYRTVGYVERDAYAAATLVARMEDQGLDRAPVWDNVATFDGRAWRGIVDLVHGGYPCQPFSVAGRKLGDKDPRHLWPHIARIVSEVEPPLCFFENVGGHLRLGFEQVHDDLRSMGYGVKAGLFTAEEVGAPHKRERLFILAYAKGAGEQRKTGDVLEAQRRQVSALLRLAHGADSSLADSYGDGCKSEIRPRSGKNDPQGSPQRTADARTGGDGSATGILSVQQRGSGTGAAGKTLPDDSRPLADTARTGTRQHKLGSRSQPQRGGQDVVDAAHMLRKKIKRVEPFGTDEGLVDADCAGLEGRRADRQQDGDTEQPFPPGPSDEAGWQRLLLRAPYLEPAVRGGSDGLAHRVDRLRLCGNGVVPLAAAYAFYTLSIEAELYP